MEKQDAVEKSRVSQVSYIPAAQRRHRVTLDVCGQTLLLASKSHRLANGTQQARHANSSVELKPPPAQLSGPRPLTRYTLRDGPTLLG